MSARIGTPGTSEGGPEVVLKREDILNLQTALRAAAAALRELEGQLALVAPKNAILVEKMAEEFERTEAAVRAGEVQFNEETRP